MHQRRAWPPGPCVKVRPRFCREICHDSAALRPLRRPPFCRRSAVFLPFCLISAGIRPGSAAILPASAVLPVATSQVHPILPLVTLFFPSVAFFRSRKKKKKRKKNGGRAVREGTRLWPMHRHTPTDLHRDRGRVGEGRGTAGAEKRSWKIERMQGHHARRGARWRRARKKVGEAGKDTERHGKGKEGHSLLPTLMPVDRRARPAARVRRRSCAPWRAATPSLVAFFPRWTCAGAPAHSVARRRPAPRALRCLCRFRGGVRGRCGGFIARRHWILACLFSSQRHSSSRLLFAGPASRPSASQPN